MILKSLKILDNFEHFGRVYTRCIKKLTSACSLPHDHVGEVLARVCAVACHALLIEQPSLTAS